MSKKQNTAEMTDEGVQHTSARSIPVVASYGFDETFALTPEEQVEELPLLPLRNMTIFPGTYVPIFVGREKSKLLLESLPEGRPLLAVITQRDAEVEDVQPEGLYPIGTVVEVVQMMDLPTGDLSVVLRGRQRFQLREVTEREPFFKARIDLLNDQDWGEASDREIEALVDLVQEYTLQLIDRLAPKSPKAFIQGVRDVNNRAYMLNLTASLLQISDQERQQLLELPDLWSRGMQLLTLLQSQLKETDMKEMILQRTKAEMDQQQRDYFLQQQMRVIQDELGNGGDSVDDEIQELRDKGAKKHWSEEVAEIFAKELRKAERLNPQSPDFSIQMQYLRTVVDLPWGEYSEDNFDLKQAREILDRDHFGLEQVKERILEHLAVLKLKGDMKSPIICLYGPPGVGKTSLGRSIAESLGRKYVRVSLGGVHDESEIRGHRRTYIGAMSGRIIQSLQKAGTSNPVFVLDEIDKLSSDYKGDPASALLEVLDPEQNTTFHDNYLDIDYDLSKVLFIATANNVAAIPQALRDRMELIEVTGYIAEEKLQIAQKHLVPKEAKEHGLTEEQVHFSPEALEVIIEEYTRESGVRSLTKKIASVLRKVAWAVASGDSAPELITPDLVRSYLGKPVYSRDKYQTNEYPGVVVGLAWTSVGGEILFIESSLQPGQTGKLTLTGSLGDVMKESATIALSYIRSHAQQLGVDLDLLKDHEIHIHVPEGAIPKDGPSAGVTMVTSLVSAITRRKVRAHLAMTGEITLRGKVLPVGGIKEKILAAKRSGITDIILCQENEKDIAEIDQQYLQGLTFHYVEEIQQVLDFALLDERAEGH